MVRVNVMIEVIPIEVNASMKNTVRSRSNFDMKVFYIFNSNSTDLYYQQNQSNRKTLFIKGEISK